MMNAFSGANSSASILDPMGYTSTSFLQHTLAEAAPPRGNFSGSSSLPAESDSYYGDGLKTAASANRPEIKGDEVDLSAINQSGWIDDAGSDEDRSAAIDKTLVHWAYVIVSGASVIKNHYRRGTGTPLIISDQGQNDLDRRKGYIGVRLFYGANSIQRGNELPLLIDSTIDGLAPGFSGHWEKTAPKGSWIDNSKMRKENTARLHLATGQQSRYVGNLLRLAGYADKNFVTEVRSWERNRFAYGFKMLHTVASVDSVVAALRALASLPKVAARRLFGGWTSTPYALVRGLFNDRFVAPLVARGERDPTAERQFSIIMRRLDPLVASLKGRSAARVVNAMRLAANHSGVTLGPIRLMPAMPGDNRAYERLDLILGHADVADPDQAARNPSMAGWLNTLQTNQLHTFLAQRAENFNQNTNRQYFVDTADAWRDADVIHRRLATTIMDVLRADSVLTADAERLRAVRDVLRPDGTLETLITYIRTRDELNARMANLVGALARAATGANTPQARHEVLAIINHGVFGTPELDIVANMRERFREYELETLANLREQFQRARAEYFRQMGTGGGQGFSFGSTGWRR